MSQDRSLPGRAPMPPACMLFLSAQESIDLAAPELNPRPSRDMLRRSASFRTLVACALLAAPVGAGATVIYRWVDEHGRTHVSDVVPEKYKRSATRVDSGAYEVSPQLRQEAEERAAKEKALADEAARRRAVAPPPVPGSAAPLPVATKRPAQAVTESTDCPTWWRLYRESQECFGAFRTVGGGIKAEAFDKCNPIPSPEPKCGPFRP